MSDEIQLQPPPNSANGTEDGNEQPLYRYAVSVVFLKYVKGEDGEPEAEIRVQGFTDILSPDDPGAEWLAVDFCKKDGQIPDDYHLNTVLAMRIEDLKPKE